MRDSKKLTLSMRMLLRLHFQIQTERSLLADVGEASTFGAALRTSRVLGLVRDLDILAQEILHRVGPPKEVLEHLASLDESDEDALIKLAAQLDTCEKCHNPFCETCGVCHTCTPNPSGHDTSRLN